MLLFYESGIYTAFFYASHIFMEAGLSERHVNLISTIAIGAVQVFATLASVVLVDCLGRKFLLTLSSTGMALSCLVLGTVVFTSTFMTTYVTAVLWVTLLATSVWLTIPFTSTFPATPHTLGTSSSLVLLSS